MWYFYCSLVSILQTRHIPPRPRSNAFRIPGSMWVHSGEDLEKWSKTTTMTMATRLNPMLTTSMDIPTGILPRYGNWTSEICCLLANSLNGQIPRPRISPQRGSMQLPVCDSVYNRQATPLPIVRGLAGLAVWTSRFI